MKPKVLGDAGQQQLVEVVNDSALIHLGLVDTKLPAPVENKQRTFHGELPLAVPPLYLLPYHREEGKKKTLTSNH